MIILTHQDAKHHLGKGRSNKHQSIRHSDLPHKGGNKKKNKIPTWIDHHPEHRTNQTNHEEHNSTKEERMTLNQPKKNKDINPK